MVPRRSHTLFFVAGMLITGTANTILNKYQDRQCVGNCDDPDPSRRHNFEQPLWQTLNMFIGEFSCILVYLYVRFFKTQEFTADLGLAEDNLLADEAADQTEHLAAGIGGSAVGVMMVLVAQMFSASQFVVEEKILSHYHLQPSDGVWLEGLFGIISVGTAMPILHYFIGSTHPGGYFDVPNGWAEISNHPSVWFTGIFIALSIAFFNFFGLSVTRTISATSRSTIDTSRTLFIWLFSLLLGWETFSFLQVGGFSLLVYGTFLFNGVVSPPICLAPDVTANEHRPLLN
ncbi:hypothetical protein L0F63_006011 [Massospora cicadina]|nr:hypothetical protein L0F63_006011 [Massospora cicadina]